MKYFWNHVVVLPYSLTQSCLSFFVSFLFLFLIHTVQSVFLKIHNNKQSSVFVILTVLINAVVFDIALHRRHPGSRAGEISLIRLSDGVCVFCMSVFQTRTPTPTQMSGIRIPIPGTDNIYCWWYCDLVFMFILNANPKIVHRNSATIHLISYKTWNRQTVSPFLHLSLHAACGFCESDCTQFSLYSH